MIRVNALAMRTMIVGSSILVSLLLIVGCSIGEKNSDSNQVLVSNVIEMLVEADNQLQSGIPNDIMQQNNDAVPRIGFADQNESALVLQNELEEMINSNNEYVSVMYANTSDESDWASINESEPVVAASVIKLLILAEALDEVAQGSLSLDGEFVVEPEDIVGGTGVIQGMGPGAVLTLDELLQYMIIDSDNVATNMIIDYVGMDKINEQAKKLGLDSTTLNRRMMDMDAISSGIENYVSARDVATILFMLYRGDIGNQDLSEHALEILRNQNIVGGIEAGIPSEVAIGHKTGSLVGVENDAAIVFDEPPYILVVLVSGGEGGGIRVASEISALVWNHRIDY